MSLITQQIKALTGGVSQAPASRRLAEQVTALVNGWPEQVRGLGKRPTSNHVALLAADESGYTAAFEHLINRDETNRYRVVIIDDDLIVYDETGTSQTVTFPHGKGYLNAPTPNTTFRAVTVGEKTYIVNTSKLVLKSTSTLDKASVRTNEALLWFREGDFSTEYAASFTYGGTTWNPTITSDDGSTVEDRSLINPKYLASAMKDVMTDTAQQDMVTDGWSIVQYDNVLHVMRSNGDEFAMTTGEGVEGTGQSNTEKSTSKFKTWMAVGAKKFPRAGKNAFVGIYDTVDRIEDLPPQAPDNFRVEVIGDPSNEYDNSWFIYTNGAWQECVAPGEVVALDGSTMPHELVLSTLIYDDIESIRAANLAVTSDDTGGSAKSDTSFWDTQNDAGTQVTSSAPLTTVGQSQANSEVNFYCNLQDADGVETTYEVNLNVDCSTLAGGQFAAVIVYYNDGVGSTNWTYGDDVDLNVTDGQWSGTLSFTATLSANFDVRIYMRTQQGWVDGYGASIYADSVDFVALATNTPKLIDLEAGTIYPVGTVVTATVNANPNAYTVTGDDETAEEVATGLEVLIEDDTDITSSVSGAVITVSHATATPTVTIASSYDSSKTVIVSRNLGWTADQLVGLTVENLTDGSSGVITSNGSQSITASAGLSGGHDNTFQYGDVIRVITNSATFVFQQVNWKRRACGDYTTNPWPSFVDQYLSEVFFHKGRLGFAWNESLVMSRAGEQTGLFRKSARQILDADPIDIKYAGRGSSIIHSAIEMNEELILFSEIGQMVLGPPSRSEQPLTPRTATLLPLTHYENSGKVRPLPYGSRVMFCLADGGATQVYSYVWNEQERPKADSLCPHVPTYLQGNPISWAVSKQHNAVFVLTSADQSLLYAGKIVEDRGDVDGAWCKWQFDSGATILSVDVMDDTLGMVVSRASGLFLETINIAEGFQSTLYLDRLMDQDDVTSSTYVPAIQVQQDFTASDGTDILTLGYSGINTNVLKVLNNKARNYSTGSGYDHYFVIQSAYYDGDLDGMDYYADMTRPSSSPTGAGASFGLSFWQGSTDPSSTDMAFIYYEHASANTVNIKAGRLQGGGPETQTLESGFSLAAGASFRLGCSVTIQGAGAGQATVVVWREDAGGGNRVSLGTWTAYNGTIHNTYGLVGFTYYNIFGGNDWEVDNHTVISSSGDTYTDIVVGFDVLAGAKLYLKSDLTTEISYTEPTAGTIRVADVDYSATAFWIGYPMTFTTTLSEIFNRDFRTGVPLIGGKLQLLTALFEYADTVNMSIGVARTTPSRNFTYAVANAAATTGQKQVPVGTSSDNVVLTVTDSSLYQLWLQALTWEGDYLERARRF